MTNAMFPMSFKLWNKKWVNMEIWTQFTWFLHSQTSNIYSGFMGSEICSFEIFALMNDDCVLSHSMTWSYRMQHNQNTDQLDGQRHVHVSNNSCFFLLCSFTKHKCF